MPAKIQHLEDVKKIRTIEDILKHEMNMPLFDISNWNSGEQYKKQIMENYHINAEVDIQDYRYSYELNDKLKKMILQKLGFDFSKESVIFPSSTAAICCICDYLKKQGLNKVCILEPAYFSIAACLDSFGLSVNREYINLDENHIPLIPYESILQNNYDVLWITSPIFSTGVYYNDIGISLLLELANKGIFVIIDESISSPNRYIGNTFKNYSNVLSIISPPKYLAINSQKFCVVVCNSLVENYLFDWIDVFIGSLPSSSFIAIDHFLSDNYNKCVDIHDEYVKKSIDIINDLTSLYPNNFYTGSDSSYVTIQNKKQSYLNKIDYNFFYNFMKATNTSLIPGYINNFSRRWGFCYRVNLTLNHFDIKFNLGRVFNYFE